MKSNNSIKYYLPLFSDKLHSDYGTFSVIARLRVGNQKAQVRTDIPLQYILAQHFACFGEESVHCDISVSYEGG